MKSVSIGGRIGEQSMSRPNLESLAEKQYSILLAIINGCKIQVAEEVELEFSEYVGAPVKKDEITEVLSIFEL